MHLSHIPKSVSNHDSLASQQRCRLSVMSSSIQLVLCYCVFRNLLRFHINQFGDEKLFLSRTVLLTENYLMFTWDRITFSLSFLFVLSASEIC